MIKNGVLEALKNRRSIKHFSEEPVPDEHLTAILEAGRWAPSWLNVQPWKFIIITDEKIRLEMCNSVPVVEKAGVKTAPVCISVCVEAHSLSAHLAEDGAAATMYMALAAHSLGLASYWVGIFDYKNRRSSNEAKIKKILHVPERFRIVSLLPIGFPTKSRVSKRKALDEIVHHNSFAAPKNHGITPEQALRRKVEIEGEVSFAHNTWNDMGNHLT